MNINQAKAVAGIHYRTRSRADFERASLDCKKEIIAARRAGDDTRAALLSEAKEFFKKLARAKNICAVCGVPVSRGAAHCRIHQRQNKAIASPDGLKPQPMESEKRNGNARVASDDHLASLGYYAAPIKKVVARWRDIIGNDELEHYFFTVAMTLFYGRMSLKFDLQVSPDHWPAIFELGTAIVKLRANKRTPHAWLLNESAPLNGKHKSWEEIRAGIIKRGGPAFAEGTLRKASHCLKLSTSKESKEVFRHLAVTKTD
jgi:hypothetical protein